MSQTIASFLREKATNMSNWLSDEGFRTEMELSDLDDLALTTLAHMLNNNHRTAIEQRDFSSFRAEKENLPPAVERLLDFVEPRAPLHDKFWRYLGLFSEVVSNHE